jgi:hypothetical protein
MWISTTRAVLLVGGADALLWGSHPATRADDLRPRRRPAMPPTGGKGPVSEMNAVLAWVEDVCLRLTPTGRERIRRLRRAEIEAAIAAERMQAARLLACIGAYQLRLADLSRQHAVAEHPQLARPADRVVNSLTEVIRDEIDGFSRHGPEPLS